MGSCEGLAIDFYFIFSFVFRTFLTNMKAFGLSDDICGEFLQKMGTIGDLSEGNECPRGKSWYERHETEACLNFMKSPK